MPSPFVRRRRLAAAIRKVREDRDMTADELARRVYRSRAQITRLETGQCRPDLAHLMDILDVLEITGRQRNQLIRLARDAAERGWWDSFGDTMGPRQKLYADLESAADTIREYSQTAMPAALQTPEFTQALVELDTCEGPLSYRPERMAEARARRQEHLLQPNGPKYEAVLDESMIHRLAVTSEAKATQLRHLITVVSGDERIIVQVLPSDVPIPGGLLPRSSFSLYTFPERSDPPLAVVDTVTTDLVLDQRKDLGRYVTMYDRLRKAALSPANSLSFLSELAARLSEQTGSET
ncbi:helix-turn-helix domain-containing protein [Actinomadura hibisca]|uniref:helix-turn-helix domain-containing protein n=1 Tax=Actinomadura hibisca TaxID=68565 RepID=UPI00082CDA06|nr:helix-turn-helix transcriptional regulator [Actinomadura hibisca]